MSNINDKATVSLFVNGEQAEAAIDRLRKKAEDLDKQLQTAIAAGDKKSAIKLRRELDLVTKELNMTESAAKGAGIVLNDLSNSSIHGLRNALKFLKKELRMAKPDSEAWNHYARQVELVRGRLNALNDELRESESLWSKFKGWSLNAWPALDLLRQWGGSISNAMRGYVNAYAEMEQEMANVRKYTGMTAEEVEALNEELKKIDTRSSRVELNQLAQEAGRLGKTSQEDVLGFVRAADKINVALDDLGDGATLTLSKLTGIFGDEERLGTEKALLSVGSVINELSQNCSASAPYIAEFTSRLGGVGAQAGMTSQQIMAFAAVLDSANQPLEASATALSQVIVRLLQKPALYAKVAGLDVKKFSELVKTDMNSALLELLSALNRAGGMDVLSPMFKDMGENGSRAVEALSTLAGKIEKVKSQQIVANQAFAEATSIDKEFNVQNNTVMAGMEKAKKRLSELTIQLGEKLMPLMKHVYSSSTVLLKVISTLINFLSDNAKVIGALAGTLAVYYAWLGMAKAAVLAKAAAEKIGVNVMKLYNVGLKLTAALMEPLNLLFVAFRNSLTYVTKGFEVNMAMQTRWRAALLSTTGAFKALMTAIKATPFGLLATAVTGIVIGLSSLFKKTESLADSFRRMSSSVIALDAEFFKEMDQLNKLYSALKNAKEGTDEYNAAKKSLIDSYGGYLKGIIDEKGEIVDLGNAYIRLANAIKHAAKERAIDKIKETIETKYFDSLSENLDKLEATMLGWGATKKDAEYVKNDVAGALASGGKPSDRSLELIKFWSDQFYSSAGNGFQRFMSGVGAVVNQIPVLELVEDDDDYRKPNSVFAEMWNNAEAYRESVDALDSRRAELSEFSRHTDEMLEKQLDLLKRIADGTAKGGRIRMPGATPDQSSWIEVTKDNVNGLLENITDEINYRTVNRPASTTLPDTVPSINPSGGYTSMTDAKEQEKAARRAAIKARKAFKEALDKVKGDWEAADTLNTVQYGEGEKQWTEYLQKKYDLEIKYFNDRKQVYETFNLQEDEDYQALLKKKAETEAAWAKRKASLTVEDARREQKKAETQVQIDFNTPGSALYHNEEALQLQLFDIRIKYLQKIQAVYDKTSKEWHDYQAQIDQAQADEQLRLRKLYAQRYAEWMKKYEYLSAAERHKMELDLLDKMYYEGLVSYEQYLEAKRALDKKYGEGLLPDSAKKKQNPQKQDDDQKAEDLKRVKSLYEQGELTEEEYTAAVDQINKTYFDRAAERARKFGSEHTNMLLDVYQAWRDFFEKSEEDGDNWAKRLGKLMQATSALMNAGMQQASALMQAETDLQVAKAEKKYDREIEMAQGSSYKTAKLEKKKEQEIAKIKADAVKKQFAMKVASAVADTASNAIMAYGSAQILPFPMSMIMGGVAAAMATAMGLVQIATIKKQQQLAEAQGYSEGGFTPRGRKDEPAGIVHAGEWVASQKLLANPVARPMIEALDYAQRTNTIGSLRPEDVSRSIRANDSLVRLAADNGSSALLIAAAVRMSQTVDSLTQRLHEPFVTVNTVAGDSGILRAQEEYQTLMRNKNPKHRR